MTEPKAPVAWRYQTITRFDWAYSSFKGVSGQPLALHSDYMAEKGRADKAETQVADITARAEKAEAEARYWANSFELGREVELAMNAKLVDLLRLRDAASDELADLTAKLDEARGVLKSIEWGGEYDCPSCGRVKIDGHKPGCRLAAVLAPETEKETP